MEIINTPLSYYVSRLQKHECFSFARYGNGEWGCILQLAKRTGSGSQGLDIPDLRLGLENGLRFSDQVDYFLGTQSESYLTRCRLFKRLEEWLKRNASGIAWHNGDVFHKASMKGMLYSLVKQLRQMDVVVVGPGYLKALDKEVFKYTRFVQVPVKDCYSRYQRIYEEILSLLEGPSPPEVISFSAGPTAKVLIHTLHSRVRECCSLIDFGSLWDPYCSKNTRRYHKRVTAAIQEQNLTGRV